MTRKGIIRVAAALLATALLSGAAALAAPGWTAEQTEPVRILFQLPPGGGKVTLGNGVEERDIPHDGGYAVLEAPPGSYTLRCGELSAALRLGAEPEVLGGCAAWDGEMLTMGQYGTLELVCSPRPDQQLSITIQAADGVHTRAAAYDPALGGEPVRHWLNLPAGMVTVSWEGGSQSLTIRPGETAAVELR